VPRTVLVTDAGIASSLSVIRSLGRRGDRVIAVDHDRSAPGLHSRHAERAERVPSSLEYPGEFAAALLELVRAHSVDLVIPVTDASILALAEVRAELEATARVALPDARALERASDKAQTLELARELGVPVPDSHEVTTVEEALAAAPDRSFPIVLKPRTSRLAHAGEETEAFEVCYALDTEQLGHQMRRFEGRCPVLLQEFVTGRGLGVELLMDRGRPVAGFQHERLREVPVSGGASAYRRSVPLDPQLYEYSVRLLGALGWTGLAMVEFKQGVEGPKLMEINGRIWGSLPLALHCGMDFPARLADLVLAPPAEPEARVATDYTSGRCVHNLQRELLWIGSVLLARGRTSPLPPPPRRAAFAAAASLLSPAARFDVLSWSDPRPGAFELARIARKLRRKSASLSSAPQPAAG